MANEHRRLGTCIEIYPKDGGWVAQRWDGSSITVVHEGFTTKEEAQARYGGGVPTFYLTDEPDAS